MIDPILLFWILVWTSICPYGIYLILTEDRQASSFYVYGKSLDLNKRKGLFWRIFLLPKSYFIHFYVTAIAIFIPSLAIIIVYYVPSEINTKLIATINSAKKLLDNYVQIEISDSLTLISSLTFTVILMTIQSSRRLYESVFISVYSKNSKINIIHYLFGHAFYLMTAISTVCPILLSQTSSKYTLADLLDNLVTKRRALAFVLFIYVSHYQHKCHVILANLRKDKTGRVITEQHYVPSGSLFEYVSCPHFLIEIIIYFLILVIQNFSISYWNLIFLLVLSTQTINAINEHKWYKRKYTDYPKEKKAIFPCLL